MSRFEVGDKMIVVKSSWRFDDPYLGTIGTIECVEAFGYQLRFMDKKLSYWYDDEVLEATELGEAIFL